MKNIINYYYNIIPKDIHQTEKKYYFTQNNIKYILVLYQDNPNILNDLYNLHLNLRQNGIYMHEIILNKDGQIITLINSQPYILLKATYYKEKINYNMIFSFSQIPLNPTNLKETTIERGDLSKLWSQKDDYLEYQMSQLGQKHKILRESFSYYIGLGENSIALVNTIPTNNLTKVISHKRIKETDTVEELYNPLNLIIDSKVRDASEYFKNSFFNNKNITKELNHFIQNANLTKIEHILFFARMLYPTYYFDLYEEIISGNKKDEEIKKITDLTNDYEKLIKKLYNYYRNTINIIPIEWLER